MTSPVALAHLATGLTSLLVAGALHAQPSTPSALPSLPPNDLANITNINQLPALESTVGQLREQFLGEPAAMANGTVAPLVTPDRTLDNVTVSACWIRAMPLPDLPMAMYFVVHNQRQATIDLTGVSSEAFGQTSLHQIVVGDGNARTLQISSVPIGPGETQALTPNELHALLAQPRHTIAVGSEIPMTFLFGTDGRITQRCQVQASTALHYQAP